MELLAEVGVMDGETDKLQWSVVYNLSELSGQIFAHRKMEHAVKFALKQSVFAGWVMNRGYEVMYDSEGYSALLEKNVPHEINYMDLSCTSLCHMAQYDKRGVKL